MLGVEVHDASNTTWLRVEGRFVGAFAEDTKALVVLGGFAPRRQTSGQEAKRFLSSSGERLKWN